MSRLPPTRRGGTTEWIAGLGEREADGSGERLQRYNGRPARYAAGVMATLS